MDKGSRPAFFCTDVLTRRLNKKWNVSCSSSVQHSQLSGLCKFGSNRVESVWVNLRVKLWNLETQLMRSQCEHLWVWVRLSRACQKQNCVIYTEKGQRTKWRQHVMAKSGLISLLMCRLCRLCLFCVYPVLATVFMKCLLISASIQDWHIRVCCNQAYCVDMCTFDFCLLTRLSFVFLLVFLLICDVRNELPDASCFEQWLFLQ